jgi:hypothetical protein
VWPSVITDTTSLYLTVIPSGGGVSWALFNHSQELQPGTLWQLEGLGPGGTGY